MRKDIVGYLKLLMVFLLLLAIFRGVFVLVVLIALSFSMSFFVNRFKLRQIGIELVTFTAVYSAVKFGPWIALVITLILITYHLAAGGFLGEYIIWVIPAYCAAAVLAGFFRTAEISALGLYVILGISANNLLFTALRSPGYLPKYLIYVVTNVLFNIFLFWSLGLIVRI